jgi:glycerol-3-phosphate acyltransferase PlsY
MDLLFIVLSAVLSGYLFGSLPFGLILCRVFGYGDIRKIGSGNIGATNVLRTGNKPLAALTLLLDAGKGAIAVGGAFWIASVLSLPQDVQSTLMIVAGGFAVIGHMFPVWLKFKGGKGVATFIGMVLALMPYAGLALCGAWLVMAILFRISSLSALVATLLTPAIAFFIYDWRYALMSAAVTALIWLRHKDNIKRIIQGQEPKIGVKKAAS